MLRFLRGVVIAQIAEGCLEGALGLILLLYGLFEDPVAVADSPLGEHAKGYFLGVGALMAGLGALRIVVGIANWGFRGWGLGVTALFLGLATVLTVYCACTALPLLGTGLFAYLNGNVRRAFEMRRDGTPVSEIEEWLAHGGETPPGLFD